MASFRQHGKGWQGRVRRQGYLGKVCKSQPSDGLI
jgi:hypothetical protein